MISLEDFKKVDIVVGKILSAKKVPDTDKLLIRGISSEGMILAVSTNDGKFSLLLPNDAIPVGMRAR